MQDEPAATASSQNSSRVQQTKPPTCVAVGAERAYQSGARKEVTMDECEHATQSHATHVASRCERRETRDERERRRETTYRIVRPRRWISLRGRWMRRSAARMRILVGVLLLVMLLLLGMLGMLGMRRMLMLMLGMMRLMTLHVFVGEHWRGRSNDRRGKTTEGRKREKDSIRGLIGMETRARARPAESERASPPSLRYPGKGRRGTAGTGNLAVPVA